MSGNQLPSWHERSGVPRPAPGSPGQLQWTLTPTHAAPVSESDGAAPRLRARSTPVPSIKEGILDNDAIGAGLDHQQLNVTAPLQDDFRKQGVSLPPLCKSVRVLDNQRRPPGKGICGQLLSGLWKFRSSNACHCPLDPPVQHRTGIADHRGGR